MNNTGESEPKVAVLIPCYNEEKNLERGVLDEVYQYMEWLCKDQKLATRFSREGDEVVVLT